MKANAVVVFVVLLLAGCAGIPEAVDRPVSAPEIALAAVQNDPDQYRGQVVRWGGSVVKTVNNSGGSQLEVLARPLQGNSRPTEAGESPGRFMVASDDFLDPEVFKSGTLITVVGALSGVKTGKVGEYDYHYPIVQVEGLHLWSPLPERRPAVHDPYWDSPWAYPFGPYPYYRYRNYPYHFLW